MSVRSILSRCRELVLYLLHDQGGQTSLEYMAAIALLVCGILIGLFLVVPGLEDGFVALTQRIRDMNP